MLNKCWFPTFSLPPSGFPGGSDSKESAYNAGDSSSIPRSGRFPGEGRGYPTQYSCLENSWSEEPGGLQSMGSQSRTLTEQLTFSLSNLLPFSPSPPSFPFPSLLFSSFVLHITNDECEEAEHRVLAQRKFISNQASVFTSVARKGGNTQMSFPVLKELIENQSYIQGRENPTGSTRYFQALKKFYT